MLVKEIFKSIQGEGPYIGVPCVFIRFAGCNINCIWCDEKSENIQQMTKQQVLEEVDKLNYSHTLHDIIITGGEPMIHHENDEFIDLLSALRYDLGYNLHLETNATIYSPSIYELFNIIVVSPKLASSGVDRDKRINDKTLSYLANKRNTFFKFVISNRTDLQEVLDIILEHKINHQRVYLMTEYSVFKSKSPIISEIIDTCLKLGFRFTIQLHKIIYVK